MGVEGVPYRTARSRPLRDAIRFKSITKKLLARIFDLVLRKVVKLYNEYKAPDIEDPVRRRFQQKDYVVVTKGGVPDILHEIAPDRIAFLHLDMNSPRAETGALEVLFDRISPGGIIVFDDYGWKLYQSRKRPPTDSWPHAAKSFWSCRPHRSDDQAVIWFGIPRQREAAVALAERR